MSDARQLGRSASSAPDEAETLGVSAPIAAPLEVAMGANVSRYVVLEEVGQGAMGRVLRAYDPKLQREVALKEVRRESLDESSARRLVAEARAMAKLSHPNVVGVYDVEALQSGSLVLVMEFVAGQTLRCWLGGGQRRWVEIVARFAEAGRGLVAAHDAGLLHRDFKPDNVLVANVGGVKVTDFGLATSAIDVAPRIGSESGETTPTDASAASLVVGTPRFMAPEQHRGQELGPAVDQYAFCIALWEALCGEPPFSGRSMADSKEAGPPIWPNGGTPRPIVDAVTRGLAPIVADRWLSMAELLRALSWDPVRRRNRWVLGVAAVGTLTGSGLAWQLWADARSQRCAGGEIHLLGVWDDARKAEARDAVLGVRKPYVAGAWERIERDLDGYSKAFARMHTEACEATTVRGEQSVDVMDLRMACLRQALVDLRATVDQLADADEGVVRNAHELTKGLRPLSRCADLEALSEGVEPPLPEEARTVDEIRERLAESRAQDRAGRYQASRVTLAAARAALESVEYGPLRTEVALREAQMHERLGEYELAEASLREVLELASRWRQRSELAAAARNLMFVVGYQQQRMDQGLPYAELAQGIASGDPAEEAAAAETLGMLLQAQGQYADAEAEHRRALALRQEALDPDHPDIASSRNNLAMALHGAGRDPEAEKEFRGAHAILEQLLGAEHPQVATVQANLASVLADQGRHVEALAEHRRALAIYESALPPDHPQIGAIHANVALALQALGETDQAEAEFRLALRLLEATLGTEHPHVAATRNNLAGVLEEQRRYAEAEAEHRHALKTWMTVAGPDHPDVGIARHGLAMVLELRGEFVEAEPEYRQALATLHKALGPDHPDVALVRVNFAGMLLDRERPAEALPLLEQAWKRQRLDDVPPERKAQSAFGLARAWWSTQRDRGTRTRARQLAERALKGYSDAGPRHLDDTAEVRRWLDEHPVPPA